MNKLSSPQNIAVHFWRTPSRFAGAKAQENNFSLRGLTPCSLRCARGQSLALARDPIGLREKFFSVPPKRPVDLLHSSLHAQPTSKRRQVMNSDKKNHAASKTRRPRSRRAPKMPEAQRRKLSIAHRAYRENDPRWPAHRQKLVDAAFAKRFTLSNEEIRQVVAMRKRGWSFSYIQEELCVCYEVIVRELTARGISTARGKWRRAKRGKGFWGRVGDDPNPATVAL
jgi:hypothetical protein